MMRSPRKQSGPTVYPLKKKQTKDQPKTINCNNLRSRNREFGVEGIKQAQIYAVNRLHRIYSSIIDF